MADATPIIALAAGLTSFFSPCVLPVLPGYVSFISGGPTAVFRDRALRTSLFVIGFGASFIVLGLLVGAAGQSAAAHQYQDWLAWVGGALIIAFGLAMTGLLRLDFLERDVRYHGRAPLERFGPSIGALSLGAAFAVGWTPCVGPILASILILAGTGPSLAHAALLLALYSLGLAIPLFLVGLGADRSTRLLRRFQRTARGIQVAGGILLILLGVVVFTGTLARFTSYLLPGGANAA